MKDLLLQKSHGNLGKNHSVSWCWAHCCLNRSGLMMVRKKKCFWRQAIVHAIILCFLSMILSLMRAIQNIPWKIELKDVYFDTKILWNSYIVIICIFMIFWRTLIFYLILKAQKKCIHRCYMSFWLLHVLHNALYFCLNKYRLIMVRIASVKWCRLDWRET